MRTDDFDFELPPELIAQRPPAERGNSRMMVIDRESRSISHHHFSELSSFITADDLLVLNDTRVVAARFYSNDRKKELLRIDASGEKRWRCLVKPGRKFKVGAEIKIGSSTGIVLDVLEGSGERIIEFDNAPSDQEYGHLALPPYIDRPDDSTDSERYQTVYANESGAIAAPTAGLHFDQPTLDRFRHAFVTLHVGIGTFRPVSSEEIADHHMHSESYELPGTTIHQIEQAQRTIAVGTTVVRVLESVAAAHDGRLVSGRGTTDIFIYPPYQFASVDGLLTNFHLPKSTLLMLVSALTDRDLMLEAYREAVAERYRFFSYGDCMLII
ncbi:MAG: tRNA preQ1(34) S-adenosylmethionine ribosyltransferase-isomerase QueA [Verrucomicrobiota bacterium]